MFFALKTSSLLLWRPRSWHTLNRGLQSNRSTLLARSSQLWSLCLPCRFQKLLMLTQHTFFIVCRKSFWMATASGNRWGYFTAFVASITASSFATAVATSVDVFRQRFLRNLALVLDFPRLRTVTAIVIYDAWLGESNSSATTTSVLEISGAYYRHQWQLIQKVKVLSRQVHLPRKTEGNQTLLAFFSAVCTVQTRPTFMHCVKCVVGNSRSDVIQIETSDELERRIQRTRSFQTPLSTSLPSLKWPVLCSRWQASSRRGKVLIWYRWLRVFSVEDVVW